MPRLAGGRSTAGSNWLSNEVFRYSCVEIFDRINPAKRGIYRIIFFCFEPRRWSSFWIALLGAFMSHRFSKLEWGFVVIVLAMLIGAIVVGSGNRKNIKSAKKTNAGATTPAR